MQARQPVEIVAVTIGSAQRRQAFGWNIETGYEAAEYQKLELIVFNHQTAQLACDRLVGSIVRTSRRCLEQQNIAALRKAQHQYAFASFGLLKPGY